MQPGTRATCAVALSIFALVAVFCVVKDDAMYTRESSNKKSDKNVIGDPILRQQAGALDAARALKNKGKGIDVVDDMMGSWTAPKEDKSLTSALLADAPHKAEYDVAVSAEDLGILPKKKAPPKFAQDMNLVQYDENFDPMDWVPHGQEALADDIETARQADAIAEAEDDGISGESVLEAGGLGSFDKQRAIDTLFVQMDATAEWEPKGQAGFAEKIRDAHAAEDAEEEKEDSIHGNSLLSAAGMGSHMVGSDSDEIAFVQTDANDAVSGWTPKGQSGLGSQMAQLSQQEQEDQLVKDGLHGEDILSAASEESLFQEDSTASWSPTGQNMKHQETFEEYKDREQKRKQAEWAVDDGLYGQDILSSVSMNHHKKEDPFSSVGAITDSDFDADSLLED